MKVLNIVYPMIKGICKILLLSFVPVLIYGQNSYLTTHSTTTTGIKLIDDGDLMNSIVCQVEIKNQIKKYYPDEVKEFRFKNGRVYVSKEILVSNSPKLVFLERLNQGTATLYYYRTRGGKFFFVETESDSLIQISKKNLDIGYNEQLSAIMEDCSNVAKAIDHVSFNKRSFTKLFRRYEKCENKLFPHFTYGLLLGYELARLDPFNTGRDENIEQFNFKYDGGVTFGVFVDYPILMSDFSLHPEIYYSKHEFSYNRRFDSKDLDFVCNYSSLNIPLLLRYKYPSNRIMPYGNIGIVLGYNFKNETLLYEANSTKNLLSKDDNEDPFGIQVTQSEESIDIDDFQLGYSLGIGFELNLRCKKSLFFEYRLIKKFSNTNSKSINITGTRLVTGINF